MSAWMGSPGHRANILGRSFTQIGAAVAYGPAHDPYWCTDFGAPLAASEAAPVASPPESTTPPPAWEANGGMICEPARSGM